MERRLFLRRNESIARRVKISTARAKLVAAYNIFTVNWLFRFCIQLVPVVGIQLKALFICAVFPSFHKNLLEASPHITT